VLILKDGKFIRKLEKVKRVKHSLTLEGLRKFANGKRFLPRFVRIYMDLNTPIKLTTDDFRDYLSLVRKLYTLTSDFIKYYDDKIKQSHKKYLSELQEDIRNMVLGGLKPDCEYTDKAYGLFAEDFLGLSLEDRKLCAKPGARVIVKETKFVEFVRLLNQLSKFIIDEGVKNLNISNNVSQENNTSQQNIEDLITEIIRTVYDLSVGVNAFATGVFGLRKITPEYRKKAYENIPDDLLKALGFSKLINGKGFEIEGFPDYFTKSVLYVTGDYKTYLYINGVPILSELKKYGINTIEPKTLGGAICILNEIIWRYIDLLYNMLSKWYNGIVNIENEYIKEAWRSLDDFGWRMPEYLEAFNSNYNKAGYNDFKKILNVQLSSDPNLLMYDEYGMIFSIGLRRGVPPLSELFVDLMPAIFLGIIDTTLVYDDHSGRYDEYNKKELLIVVRTRSG